ncbi:MAG TPA: hypothetical protein VKI65_13205, partial [Gemmataceae bacterium]|nr:hypothetical protein [Gemmataceae bacterium]
DPRPCHGAVEHMVDKAAGSKAQTSRHAAKLRHAAGAVKQKDSRPLFLFFQEASDVLNNLQKGEHVNNT